MQTRQRYTPDTQTELWFPMENGEMQELGEARKIAVAGPEAEYAVTECLRQLAEWEIAPPATKPLVLDFGLGRFSETGLIEFWIANESEAGYCGKYMFVFEDQACPMHRHRKKLETFVAVKGTVNVLYGDSNLTLTPGDTLRVDRWVYHSFTAHKGPALLLEISQPCVIADNYFHDRAIPIGSNHTTQDDPDNETIDN